ncbi:MAG: PAAR-like domain-containing protein [Polyangiaceae bacterium]
MSVTAVFMEVVCEESGHEVVPCAPNMCITPCAPSPLPMPYPLTGDSSSLDPGTSKVKIEDKKTLNTDCFIKQVHGNEAGTQKDIITMQTTGHAYAVVGAPTVFFEGAQIAFTGSPGFANTM